MSDDDVTPRSILSMDIPGERPYDTAQRAIARLDRYGWTFVRKPTGDAVDAAISTFMERARDHDSAIRRTDVEAALAAAAAAAESGLSREDAVGLAHASGFTQGFKAGRKDAADGRTPDDPTGYREGCRRILPLGDPRGDLQFGPPWKPWRDQ